MKDNVILKIEKDMKDILNLKQYDELCNVLNNELDKYDFILASEKEHDNEYYINSFLSAKKVEGCSDRTVKYYEEIINNTIDSISSDVIVITTEEIRDYLSKYKEDSKCSLVTIDNIRRVLSSFFGWLESEDYIVKSPIRRIHKVKTQQVVKTTYSDENIESMRDKCSSIRDLSIIELLFSTGIRVGELVRLNKNDINFNERSCVVLGKGNKQREVYFDARTKLHLQNYLSERDDKEQALFVSEREPHQRLTISAIELIVRNIGKESDVDNPYPHKFRRTLATMAIDKGMPVEQVQKLLGHVKIETTMQYAMVNQNNVKLAHRKFIG